MLFWYNTNMNLEKTSLDQLRKMLIRIDRQLTEDELFLESVREGTRHEPVWRVGAVKARIETKQEERREVQERIQAVMHRALG